MIYTAITHCIHALLVLALVYVTAVIFTLYGVAVGAIDTRDASTWSEHLRDVHAFIN